MREIIIVQHCESEQHVNGMVGSWRDWPLTQRGHAQADAIGAWLKEKLGLNENSRVLFFSTEGDTDQENYKAIVWDGKHPSTR